MNKIEKREALARILAAVNAEVEAGLGYHEALGWIIHASVVDSAVWTAKDLLDSADPDDQADGRKYTVEQEYENQLDALRDDPSFLEDDAAAIGRRFDLNFSKPVLRGIK